MESELRIGEVARRAGVSIDTLRYYERLRLLPRTRRSSGGFRLFTAEHVQRVQFIKQAQDLRFSREEIKGLLATGGAAECRKVRDLLQRKLTELDDRLKAMKGFRRVLARHLSECEAELKRHGESACCPVVAGGKGRRAEDQPAMTKKKRFVGSIGLGAVVVALLLIAGACAKKTKSPPPAGYSTDLKELRDRFNKDKDKVRLLLILSPT